MTVVDRTRAAPVVRWRVAAALWLAGATGAACAQAGVAPAAGDATRGKALYEARCIACHSPEAHRVGPAHRGVVGRRAGGAPGYVYSDALAMARLQWTPATLDRWLADPEQLVPGQRMGYRVDQAIDRANLVAYLATLK